MTIVTNNLLFNHTYLRRLQDDATDDAAASDLAHGIHDWLGFRDASSRRVLIESWVGPVLDLLDLGHDADGDAIHVRLLRDPWGTTPFGLCYITEPGADLDATHKGVYPMAQAVFALRRHRLRWGLLTNGDQWRLIDADALRRYESYVQVDIDALAQHQRDPSALRLFYRCFHRTAFAPGTDGKAGLERLLADSARATKAAEDHLKARVSYGEGAMAQLCLGLVRSTGKTNFSDAERGAIYRDATYLLYRMLFILYAEARGLLPVSHPAYVPFSLNRLVAVAAEGLQAGSAEPHATTLWETFKRLCNAIAEGDENLGVPAYDGGLFDDADKYYLRNGAIANIYLIHALYDLAFMQDAATGQIIRIDYRDLSVRHLGSLYEGMIEYNLFVAEEPLLARREEKGGLRYLTHSEAGAQKRSDQEIRVGEVYFAQSSGERRATGTYYTPEYIVDYIVHETVLRGLAERRTELEQRVAVGLHEIALTHDDRERTRMQRSLDLALLLFVEQQVLHFHVCDPAMGSGHFLVNAAHTMAAFVVETLHLTPWDNSEIDADICGWRRRIAEHCLYGVDLRPMATELAKLSLWLATLAEGLPLSFLNHHLRHGNSLIGVRLAELETALSDAPRPIKREEQARKQGQHVLWEVPGFREHMTKATGLLAHIGQRVAQTVAEVKAQSADYEQVRREMAPYIKQANLLVARHFGLVTDDTRVRSIGQYLTGTALLLTPADEALLDHAQLVAEEREFFHWPLEFPELFFDAAGPLTEGAMGFDAVVGNPPYVTFLLLDNFERDYYRSSFDYFVMKGDIYVLFIENFGLLTKHFGINGLIAQNKWLQASYGKKAREYVFKYETIEVLIDFYDSPVFDISAYPMVMVRRNIKPLTQSIQKHDIHANTKEGIIQALSSFKKGSHNPRILDITSDLPSVETIPLIEFAQQIGQGAISGHSPAFVDNISEQTIAEYDMEKEYIIPVVSGGDIERYHITATTPKQMIHPYDHDGNSLHEDYIPGIIRYLSTFRVELESRRNYGDYLINQGVKWYELRHPAHGMRNIKLIFSEIAPYNRFVLDEVGDIACVGSVYFLVRNERFNTYSSHYMLAILNSRYLSWRFSLISPKLRGGYSRYQSQYVGRIPIRRITFPTPRDANAALVVQAIQHYTAGEDAALLDLVEAQLPPNPERSDVVHDLLAHLAGQMTNMHKERQQQAAAADLFHFIDRATPCVSLERALEAPMRGVRLFAELDVRRDDIEGLRLSADGAAWRLEVQVKYRDAGGKLAREWVDAYRLRMDSAVGVFYHHVLPQLGAFTEAKIPGGTRRTIEEKLLAIQIPHYRGEDLAPLTVRQARLAATQQAIQRTDNLIDQIVYRLYGLTEDEIAIIEGR